MESVLTTFSIKSKRSYGGHSTSKLIHSKNASIPGVQSDSEMNSD
jgi:hypothetical protein